MVHLIKLILISSFYVICVLQIAKMIIIWSYLKVLTYWTVYELTTYPGNFSNTFVVLVSIIDKLSSRSGEKCSSTHFYDPNLNCVRAIDCMTSFGLWPNYALRANESTQTQCSHFRSSVLTCYNLQYLARAAKIPKILLEM